MAHRVVVTPGLRFSPRHAQEDVGLGEKIDGWFERQYEGSDDEEDDRDSVEEGNGSRRWLKSRRSA